MPILSLLLPFLLISTTSAVTLRLSTTPSPPPSPTNPLQKLNHLATASSARASLLKQSITSTNAPLYPRGYGGYSVDLTLGTPPQTVSAVFDTGSSLVWLPCTHRYSCSSCNFFNIDPNNISTFIPKSSSSSRIIGCKNPKCNWIFPNLKCNLNCARNSNSTQCNRNCPAYVLQYASGATTGFLLSETLIFPQKSIRDFLIGCSIFSFRLPAGIAGFGRGRDSLPQQMRLKRFSYCLVSHRFDDEPVSSNLVLDGGRGGASIEYTPFRRNPTSSNAAFLEYYYVTLRKITVGGVNVRAPYKYLVPDSRGRGGTVVDSGTTFTYMDSNVFELVAREFEKQVGPRYTRAPGVEFLSGLRPCFNVSGKNFTDLPQLTFQFKGGAKMVLPLADYFSFFDDSIICLTIVSNNAPSSPSSSSGPSIILGNYQQQDFYIEYDLENERFGFKKQVCN